MMDDDRSAPHDADLYQRRFVSIERELRENTDSRRRFEIDPRAVLEEWGIRVPSGMELHIAANTDDTYHVIMPSDPNAALVDEDLTVSGGAGPVQTGGYWGACTVSSAASFPSCTSTPLSG